MWVFYLKGQVVFSFTVSNSAEVVIVILDLQVIQSMLNTDHPVPDGFGLVSLVTSTIAMHAEVRRMDLTSGSTVHHRKLLTALSTHLRSESKQLGAFLFELSIFQESLMLACSSLLDAAEHEDDGSDEGDTTD